MESKLGRSTLTPTVSPAGLRTLVSVLILCVATTCPAVAKPPVDVTPPAPGDSSWVETVAGGGPVGDGAAARDARLSLPGGVLFSPDGDLIIVDFGNHRVRRVDRETGLISTLAGTGEPGFSGDGGPAHRAQLARPENAAIGPDGHLYIVDSHNHRIRRVDLGTRIITTVVGTGRAGFGGDGGPAAEANLYQPEGIVFDPAGNIFLGDTLNNRIRRVDAETGVITTVAGSGEIGTSPDGTPALEMRFLRIARLAADDRGRVYIADSPSHRIQVLDPDSGEIRTLAGTGEEGYSGDGGPATEARLSFPEGVTLDRHGNVYFADLGNHRVRRVDAESGTITSVAGTGERGFSGDGGPATDGRLWSPGRLAFDGAGNLYIADILNARIRRVDRESGRISTVAGSGSLGDGGSGTAANLAIPGDLAWDGRLVYIAEYGNRRVRTLDPVTGAITTVAGGGLRRGEGVPATEAEIQLPEGIAVGPDRRLYIADSLSHKVWQVDLEEGVLSTLAGVGKPGFSGDGEAAVSAHLRMPGAVTVGPDGRIYIGDFGNSRLRVVDPTTGVIETVRSGIRHNHLLRVPVVSLASDEEAVYFLASGDPDVFRLDLKRRVVEALSVPLAAEDRPEGGFQLGDVSPVGRYLYLADTLAHRVLRLDRETGEVEPVAGDGVQGFAGDGGPALTASFFRPGALAVTPYGLFVADTFNHRVRRIRPRADVEPPPQAAAAPVHSYRLDNGFQLLVVPRRDLPLAALNLTVASGAAADPPGRSGLAHLLEHVTLTGTEAAGSRDPREERRLLRRLDEAWQHLQAGREADLDADELAARSQRFEALRQAAATAAEPGEFYGRRYESLGALGLNALTGAEVTQFFCRLPADQVEEWISLESDRLGQPLMRRFHAERTAVLQEIEAATGGRPSMWEVLMEAVWPQHPFRGSPFGRIEDVERLDRPTALAAFARLYRPERMVLTVVGDVDPEEVHRLTRDHFGALAALGPAPPPTDPPPVSEVQVHHLTGSDPPVVLMGFPAPPAVHRDRRALEVVAHWLEHAELSPLRRQLQEEDLLAMQLSLRASYPTRSSPSLFVLQLVAAPGVSGPRLERKVRRVLSRLGEVSDQELWGALRLARVDRARRLRDPATLAAELSWHQAIQGDWRHLADAARTLAELRPEDLRRVASRYLAVEGPAAAPESSKAATAAPDGEAASLLPGPLRCPEAVRPVGLANGVRILAAPCPGARLVEATLLVPAGREQEPPSLAGAGETAAQALLAVPGRTTDGASLRRRLAREGIDTEVLVGRRETLFRFTLLAESGPALVRLLTGALTTSPWPAAAWDQGHRRSETVTGSANTNPWQRSLSTLRATLGDAGGGRSFDTSRAPLARLEAWRSRRYRPSQVLLTLYGDVEAAGLAEGWDPWKPSPPPAIAAASTAKPEPGPVPAGATLACLDAPELAVPLVVVGTVVPVASRGEVLATEALAHILGAGHFSRLHHRLRLDEKLVYTVEAASEPLGDDARLLRIAAQTDSPAEVRRIILEELARLASRGVEVREAAIARSLLASRVALEGEDPAGRFERQAAAWLAGGEAEDSPGTPDVTALTSGALSDLARASLDPSRVVTVVAASRLPSLCPQSSSSQVARAEEGKPP